MSWNGTWSLTALAVSLKLAGPLGHAGSVIAKFAVAEPLSATQRQQILLEGYS